MNQLPLKSTRADRAACRACRVLGVFFFWTRQFLPLRRPSRQSKQTLMIKHLPACIRHPGQFIHRCRPVPFRSVVSYPMHTDAHTHTHTNSHRAVLLVLPQVHTLAGSWPLRKKGDEMVFPLCSPCACSRPANITENKGYTHKHTHTY